MIDLDSCDDLIDMPSAPSIEQIIAALRAGSKTGSVKRSIQYDRYNEHYVIVFFDLFGKKQNIKIWL